MSRRGWIVSIGSGLLFLGGALILSVLLLLSTERGSAWTVERIVARLNRSPTLAISPQGISGNLVEGLGVRELSVRVGEDDAGTRITIRDLELRWILPALLARQVQVNSLSATTVEIDVTSSPETNGERFDIREFLQQVFSLPAGIHIGRASVGNITLRVDGRETRIAVRSLEAELDHQELALSGTDVSVNDFSIASPSLRLQSDRSLSGSAAWGVELETLSLEGELQLSGSLDSLRVEHSLLQPHGVESSGVLNGLLDYAPEYELQHESRGVPDFPGLPEAITQQVQQASLSLTTTGTVASVMFNGMMQVQIADRPPLSAEFSGAVQDGQLSVENLALREASTMLNVSGNLQSFSPLQGNWRWQLQAEELSGLPGGVQVSALTGTGSFDHDQSSSSAFQGQLEWQVQGEGIAGLPMGMRVAGFDGQGSLGLSDAGSGLRIEAGISDLNAELNGQVLNLKGEGNVAQGQLENFALNFLQGENRVYLQGSLGEALDLNAEVDVSALEKLVPDLAGAISGNLHLSGSVETPRLNVDLRGRELSLSLNEQNYRLATATLRGTVSEAQSQLVLNLGNLQPPRADMQMTSLSLSLDGSLDSHEFTLNTEARPGTLRMSGHGAYVAGNWQALIDAASLQSEWGNWRLDDSVELGIASEAVSLSQHCWLYATLELCGQGNWLPDSGFEAALSLTGLPLAWLNTQASLDGAARPTMSQKVFSRPAALERLQADYGIFLPQQAFLDGEVSLEGEVSASGNAFDAGFMLLPGQAVAGLIRQPDADDTADSDTPDISLFTLAYRQVQASHGAEGWNALIDMGVSHEAEPGFLLESRLMAELALGNSSGDSRALDGSIVLDLPSLDWLESLVPLLDDPRGSLQADILVRGSLDRPLLQSQLSLRNGSTALPAYGLRLENLSLDVSSDDNNNFSFSGTAGSGGGNLAYSGELNTPFLPERALSLSLEGEDFQVLNLPDREVSLSPDLGLELNQQVLNVDGTVHVPVFRLTLDESALGSNRVSVSRDVYIKRQDEAGQAPERSVVEEVRSIPVTGRVELVLGDEVRFSGFGLNMKLEGNFALEQPPERALLAYGEVDVAEGSYELYGQRLETEEGKLLFLGNPANPALDIRATREVDETTVGIHISGTLNNISSQLYSTPVMPESEVLSMLITGKSLDRPSDDEGNAMLAAIANLGIEQGQGITSSVQNALGLDSIAVSGGSNLHDSSVGLGKYITPDLYMQYKFGLYDRESVISMDYRLTRRLKLEVESGISQSIDLTYTVEK